MPDDCWSVTEEGYLESAGAAVLAFHGIYPQGKQGGVEIIQHGERIATCGDVRAHPRWWRPAGYSRLVERRPDPDGAGIEVRLEHPELDLPYAVRLRGEGEAVRLTVELDRPLASPEDEPGFCLDLYPPAYFGKTFHLDGASGVFPREPNRPTDAGPDWHPLATPMACGRRLVIAPEDPLRRMVIEGVGCELALLDGRKGDEEMWFTVCTFIPAGAAGRAVEWLITPHQADGWRREPAIAVSQVGYHPDQAKRAVIELDPRERDMGRACLLRVEPDGGCAPVLERPVEDWGEFLKCRYGIFDFTDVREPGIYLIQCAGRSAGPFRIGPDVYREGVWQPTLEYYFPVQMCHVAVWNGLRIWHGACHLDDALQAPTSHEHFDGYRQGPTTDTQYEPFEHIPGLGIGGWHDAGDTDLAAGSQARTVHALALAREEFGADVDRTTVRPDERLVLMHLPDGKPDILQQVAWGAECLLGGYRAAGHSFCGIIAGDERSYYQRGEVASMTDNLVYDPSLAPDERTGTHSGRRDDRWAFTNRDTGLEYHVAAALAAASRALKGYDDPLAQECLETALGAWEYEQGHPPARHRSGYVPAGPQAEQVVAAAELLVTTGEAAFADRLVALLPVIGDHVAATAWAVARALPQVDDEAFSGAVRGLLEGYAREVERELAGNPFGVQWRPHIWGVAWQILDFARRHYYLVRAFPDLFDREALLSVLSYVLGCHPAGNLSLVSGVGARSATVTFGINRASWSYVPGGVVSGPNLVRPHFVEFKEDYPFLWQQSENVIPGGASYVFCVLAADALLTDA